MPVVWSDDGLAPALDAIIAALFEGTAVLHTCSNDVTPDEDTVLGDFTESAYDGYLPTTLANYSAAAVTAHVAESTPDPVTFVIDSGTEDVYCWYVTDSGGTTLLHSERDPAAPIVLDASMLNEYVVTAVERLQNLP